MLNREYPMLQMELGTLVTRMDVLNRTNLTKLAQSLNADLLAASEKQQNPSDLVFYFNRAALLFFRAGRYEDAVDLSWRAIEFCMACARRDSHALGKAFQPYVNIGRVKAVRGETREAVKIFREIFGFMEEGTPFSLGPYQFTKAERDAILAWDQPLQEICRTMFLAESLRALLLAKDFQRVLEFAEELGRLPIYQEATARCTLLEAKAVAYMELGNLERASMALNRLLEFIAPHTLQYSALCFLHARLLTAKDQREKAVEVIDSGKRCLQELVNNAGAKLSRDMTQTRYLLALAEYLYGLPEKALPILKMVFNEAAQLEDEVLDLKGRFLLTRIMLETAGQTLPERRQRDMLLALGHAAQETDYEFQRKLIQEYLEKELTGSGHLGLAQEPELARLRPQAFAPRCQAQLDELRSNLLACIGSEKTRGESRPIEVVS